MIGDGSIVTVIDFFYQPQPYQLYQFTSDELARYYDEWGQIGQCRVRELEILG
jgi:hypothetical protein